MRPSAPLARSRRIEHPALRPLLATLLKGALQSLAVTGAVVAFGLAWAAVESHNGPPPPMLSGP